MKIPWMAEFDMLVVIFELGGLCTRVSPRVEQSLPFVTRVTPNELLSLCLWVERPVRTSGCCDKKTYYSQMVESTESEQESVVIIGHRVTFHVDEK